MAKHRRKVVNTFTALFMLASLNLVTVSSANAGCQDYPESVTPECVAENLRVEKLRQEAYASAQAARQLEVEQAARDNAARAEAERAAILAADNALSPDDCARSTNRFVQRCIDIAVEKARLENEAKAEADRAAIAAADNALSPDDCARSTNRYLQKCIDILTEKARLENEAKAEADRAAIAAADSALSPEDCARSTNRLLQRCLDTATEKARLENEAIDTVRRVAELETLKKLAQERFTTNNCADQENSSLQVCIDATLENDAAKNSSLSLSKKLKETQSSLTGPLIGADGEVILKALIKSKTLDSKEISNLLGTRNISADDRKLITSYAQKLNSVKSSQSAASIKIPVSNSLTEEFISTTPKICKVSGKTLKTLKSGTCLVNIKFTTESGFEVEATKRFNISR